MSIPVLTNDLTPISTCESTTGFSGWGIDSTKWELDNDIFIEGLGSILLPPKNTGDGGYGYQTAAVIDLGSNLLLMWVWVLDAPYVDTYDNYGLYIRITDSTSSWTASYNDYKIGGNDVAWCGKGWHLVVLDCNRTRDRGSGTITLANIRRVGLGKVNLKTTNRSSALGMDNIMYGTNVEVTTPSFTDGANGIDFNENGASADTIDRNDGGSWVTDGYEIGDFIRVDNATDDGIYELTVVATSVLTVNIGDFTTDDIADTDAIVSLFCTLDDIYQKDGPTDDAWTGIVSKNRDGAFEINYTLILGDQSGALDSHFISRGDIIFFADQPVGTGDLVIRSAEDTGTTRILFGNSTGTGDNRVGFAGSTITQDNRTFGSVGTLDLAVGIALCELYGTTLLSVGGGATFDTTVSTPHKVFNSVFNASGQIDLGQVEAKNNVFAGYDQVSDAALLWNDDINITYSQFFANRNATGDATAIEHGDAGSFSYNNLQFAGNDYDIANTVSPSGNVTINATDSNPSTWETTDGWVDIINSVFITITLEDTLGNPVPSGSAAVYKTSDDSELMREYATAAGIAIEPFNYLTDTNIYVRIRKSSPGETRYLPYKTAGTITEDGYTLAAVLIEDSIAG